MYIKTHILGAMKYCRFRN